MPVHSTDAGVELANALLDGVFGPNRGSGAPDDWTFRVWFDDPRTDDPSEADFGGYAAVVWDSDDWLPADGGETFSDGLANFGTPSTAATDAIRFWSMHRTSDGVIAYSAPVSEPITVTGSANPVRIRLTVPYGFNN
jgi:hypothetical protein